MAVRVAPGSSIAAISGTLAVRLCPEVLLRLFMGHVYYVHFHQPFGHGDRSASHMLRGVLAPYVQSTTKVYRPCEHVAKSLLATFALRQR